MKFVIIISTSTSLDSITDATASNVQNPAEVFKFEVIHGPVYGNPVSQVVTNFHINELCSIIGSVCNH